MPRPKIIILDRDGVLNRVVVHPEQGTIDSPLRPDEVELCQGADTAVAMLWAQGFRLAIATNQPSAAKGKTTRDHLEAVHARVVQSLEAGGGRISSSHLCFHRAEDSCGCRKPKTGLLREALEFHGVAEADYSNCWMVGDGVTDVEAGAKLGLRTAFLGPRKCDACKIMEERALVPGFWGRNLLEFAEFIKNNLER